MKFDYIIGNPPYQEEVNGEGRNYAPPIYHLFINEAYKIGNKVELITPARFLFNAGSTPKNWNKMMLNNPHLKVLDYSPKSTDFFSNVDIKGGIVVTFHNKNEIYEKIGTFTPYSKLNEIIKKVKKNNFESLSTKAVSSYVYHFTKDFHNDNPEAITKMSKGHENDLKSNIFERIPECFSEQKPNEEGYLKIIGRLKNKRVSRYIKRNYINDVSNLFYYKLFIPIASGNGSFGETLADTIIGYPGDGSTETFMSIGCFNNLIEAENLQKFLKTKFVRSLLGVLKTTQALVPSKWKFVPLQDFSEDSDIDWTKPISVIDQQLYKKYDLTDEEIEFIETHVKEME